MVASVALCIEGFVQLVGMIIIVYCEVNGCGLTICIIVVTRCFVFISLIFVEGCYWEFLPVEL